MKRILILISALALCVTMLNAQMGDGPRHTHFGGIWNGLQEAITNGDVDEDVQTAFQNASEIRTQLQESRQAYMDAHDGSIEGWSAPENLTLQLREHMQIVQAWWRENRPDRPAPDTDTAGEMLRRRAQYRENVRNVYQVRQQLRECDPDSEEGEALKTQLRQLLGERKKLMRGKRGAEGGSGGDGPGRDG